MAAHSPITPKSRVWTIYRITCSACPGNVYIGITSKSLRNRLTTHSNDASQDRHAHRPLYRAMRKYGLSAFEIEAIDTASSQEEAVEKEVRHIEAVGGYRAPHVWNLTPGGAKPFEPLPSTRSRIIKANADIWSDPVRAAQKIAALTAPDVLQRKNASIKASHSRPEWKENFSEKMKLRYTDPEYKERHAAAVGRVAARNLQSPAAKAWHESEAGKAQKLSAMSRAQKSRTFVYTATSVADPLVRFVMKGEAGISAAGFKGSGSAVLAARGMLGEVGNIYKGFMWSRQKMVAEN